MTSFRGMQRVFIPLAAVAAASARRPWAAVAAWACILMFAAVSLRGLHVSASLEAMLGSQSAAAGAFHRVMTDFQAGEAILAIVETKDESVPPAHTVAFADRLVDALHTDVRTKDRVAWARSRQDPAFGKFFAEHVVPNGPYYLGNQTTRELIARFNADRLGEQFARNESLIASPGPAGDALSKQVLRDPLRLYELAAGSLNGSQGSALPTDPGEAPAPELSSDGRAVLVRIASSASINDLDAARALVQNIEALVKELNETRAEGTPATSVHLGGAYAIAATASGTIRFDSIVSTLVSIGLLYGLFVVFYRRWVTPILIGLVAAAGMMTGFGVHALSEPTVSPLAAAVAALLAGLGVDYGIHFVAHFDAQRALGRDAAQSAIETSREMALPITTNCFTSIFGFASLWPSKIEMLSDFARLGTLGLIGALLAAFSLLPALLVLTHRGTQGHNARPPRFGFIADRIGTRPRLWVGTALALVLTVVGSSLARGQLPMLEGDLTVLHPQPNEALRTTDQVLTRFAGQGEVIPVLITAASEEALLPAAFDVSNALTSARCRELGVADVLGIHRLLPDPRQASAVTQMLEETDVPSLLARFDTAVEASAFEPSVYQGYRAIIARMLSARHPPTLAQLRDFPTLSQRLLPRPGTQAGQTVLVVRLTTPLRDRDRRDAVVAGLRAALSPFPGATLAGLAAVSTELEDATREGLPQSILISVVLVLIWLTIVFRRPLDVLMALVPLLFAGLTTVGFMVVADIRFNPINSIAIPLLDGIAVDAGVFLVSVMRQARADGLDRPSLTERLRPTMHAVLLASATTITGFASLCVTHTPAIRSLGLVAAVGITASFVGAAGILVPWMLRRQSTRQASGS